MAYSLGVKRVEKKIEIWQSKKLVQIVTDTVQEAFLKAYSNYGGRGIKCLFKSSDEFARYVLETLHANPVGLDIDRIDNNGHYTPGNIRLVPHQTNQQNRRCCA